jgi:hypothetical protein
VTPRHASRTRSRPRPNTEGPSSLLGIPGDDQLTIEDDAMCRDVYRVIDYIRNLKRERFLPRGRWLPSCMVDRLNSSLTDERLDE